MFVDRWRFTQKQFRRYLFIYYHNSYYTIIVSKPNNTPYVRLIIIIIILFDVSGEPVGSNNFREVYLSGP